MDDFNDKNFGRMEGAQATALVQEFASDLQQLCSKFKDQEVDRAIHTCRYLDCSGNLDRTIALLTASRVDAMARRLADDITRANAARPAETAFLSLNEEEQIAIQRERQARDRRNARRRQKRKDARELEELRRFKAAFDAQGSNSTADQDDQRQKIK